MKKFILLIIATFIFAKEIIYPIKKITFDYYISKIAYNKKYLIAGLENGKIVIKDFNTLKTIDTLTLPKIQDFIGDLIPMPIYSLDLIEDKLLILAEIEEAKREAFIYDLKNKKLFSIFKTKDTLMKANFITKDKIFFSLLSDEAMLYDLKNKKTIYKIQVGNYVFSTHTIDENKTLALFGDESGSLKIIDIKTGKKIKEIKGFNKDKTLSIDMQKNLVINGSSDKRIGVYNIKNGYLKVALTSIFLPYAVAINPNLNNFAFQYDEKNSIAIFSMYKKFLFLLKGHKMALNKIKYIDNKTIISFSPSEILIWKIKELK